MLPTNRNGVSFVDKSGLALKPHSFSIPVKGSPVQFLSQLLVSSLQAFMLKWFVECSCGVLLYKKLPCQRKCPWWYIACICSALFHTATVYTYPHNMENTRATKTLVAPHSTQSVPTPFTAHFRVSISLHFSQSMRYNHFHNANEIHHTPNTKYICQPNQMNGMSIEQSFRSLAYLLLAFLLFAAFCSCRMHNISFSNWTRFNN